MKRFILNGGISMNHRIYRELLTKKEYPGFDKTRSENQFNTTKLNNDRFIALECGIN
jgi:hypothetical protein